MKRHRTLISWVPIAISLPPRYLYPKRGNILFFALTFATIFSVLVCTAVALIALAAINGAEKKLRDKLSGIHSHILVFPSQKDQRFISEYEYLVPKLNDIVGVTSLAPFLAFDTPLLASTDDPNPRPVTLKGIIVEQELASTNLAEYCIEGTPLLLEGNLNQSISILVGHGLANSLDKSLGDTLFLVEPELFDTDLKIFPAVITGIFKTGLVDDYTLAYISMKQAQSIVGVSAGSISGIGIKGFDLLESDKLAVEIGKTLGGQYRVDDWKSMNQNILSGISLFRRVSLILLNSVYLLVMVCLSCILLLVLHEKRTDIAILLTIGMKPLRIQAAFAFLGMLMGVAGIILAFIISPILCNFFNAYEIFSLPPEVLMIDYVPFILELNHFIGVGFLEIATLAIVGFTVTSSIYRLRPAIILRDE